MILVIMGMEVHPFNRLAKAIDELQATNSDGEEYFIQLGSCTYEPVHASYERFLPFDDLCERIRNSSVVITHAGAGSTLVCIQQGKHPILVPRTPSHGEHVDGHQISFAQKIDQLGLATIVNEMPQLPAAIAKVRGQFARRDKTGDAGELTIWLEGFWNGLVRLPPT